MLRSIFQQEKRNLARISAYRLFSTTSTSEERRAKLIVETDEVQKLIEKNEGRLRLVNGTWSPPGGPIDHLKMHEKRRLTEAT